MSPITRREYIKGFGASLIGASLSGCTQTSQIGGPDPTDAVRFSNLRWGFHCVPSPCMWALIANLENLTSDPIYVHYRLTVQTDTGDLVYEAAEWIEGWGTDEIVVRTEIQGDQWEPSVFELVPFKIEYQ